MRNFSYAVLLMGVLTLGLPSSAYAVRNRACLNLLRDADSQLKKKIVIIVGTDREGSNSGKIGRYAEGHFKRAGREDVEVEVIDLATLPPSLRSNRVYQKLPKTFEPYFDQIKNADGLIMITPEYNGSFSGVMKTFIDLVSLKDRGVFVDMPVGFMGVAAGQFGALRSIDHLRDIMDYCGSRVYAKKAQFIGVQNVIADNAEGGITITNDFVRGKFEEMMNGFADSFVP